MSAPKNQIISVLGNHGGDISLLEKSNETIIRGKINQLKANFDIIIIETQPLSMMNKAKEWIQFSDKVIAVFEANQSLDTNKKLYVTYLQTLKSKFMGLILNKVVINSRLKVKEFS